jgi:NADH:ubiquinone oxidoreductase subunit 6 (subunit J)
MKKNKMENLIYLPIFIMGAILTITPSPLHMVLSLIIILLNISLLILTQGLTFISLLLSLIYIGAIAVLFLFIIFLLNLRNIETTTIGKSQDIEKYFHLFSIYAVTLIYYLHSNPIDSYSINYKNIYKLSENTDNLSIFSLLYSQYNLFLIVITIILLLAMISVILITKEKRAKTYILYKQF